MAADNPAHAAQGRWLMLVFLLCLVGGAAWEFRESRRPLSSYQPITGVVQYAGLRQTTGARNKGWYTGFKLAGYPDSFRLGSTSPALLAELRQAQAQGTSATVYHDEGSDQARQIEISGIVVYPLDNYHQEAAGTLVLCLLVLAVAVPLALKPLLEKLTSPAEFNE